MAIAHQWACYCTQHRIYIFSCKNTIEVPPLAQTPNQAIPVSKSRMQGKEAIFDAGMGPVVATTIHTVQAKALFIRKYDIVPEKSRLENHSPAQSKRADLSATDIRGSEMRFSYSQNCSSLSTCCTFLTPIFRLSSYLIILAIYFPSTLFRTIGR